MRTKTITIGLVLAGLMAAGAAANDAGKAASSLGPATGAALPRFESLAADEAFGRRGPGGDHRIEWLYARRGLPVEVVEEAKEWRRVRDPDGALVWMHASRLSPRRTLYVAAPDGVELLAAPRAGAKVLAIAETGVTASIVGCIGSWREVSIGDRRGWVTASAVFAAGACEAPASIG